MAIDRSGTYDQNSTPAPSGTEFLTQYGSFVDALIDTALLRLTTVAGTDTITASAEPFEVPATGLVSGMKFTIVPAANNTGPATLNIDSRGAQNVVNGDGTALTADTLVSGTRYILEFDGTNFVIIGSTGSASGAAASRTTYDTTTVWENNFPANTLIEVELWGAGGGGSAGGGSTVRVGGGGGGYAKKLFKAGDLPTSVTITIPSGGGIETDGGNATFGSLLTGYGGGAGIDSADGAGGGGEATAGSGSTPGRVGGGDVISRASGASGRDARSVHGGGGGGGASGGGFAVNGGGGGGAGGSGGTSVHGGNGGGTGAAGARPGGGGGSQAVGGAGRCIITVHGS